MPTRREPGHVTIEREAADWFRRARSPHRGVRFGMTEHKPYTVPPLALPSSYPKAVAELSVRFFFGCFFLQSVRAMWYDGDHWGLRQISAELFSPQFATGFQIIRVRIKNEKALKGFTELLSPRCLLFAPFFFFCGLLVCVFYVCSAFVFASILQGLRGCCFSWL